MHQLLTGQGCSGLAPLADWNDCSFCHRAAASKVCSDVYEIVRPSASWQCTIALIQCCFCVPGCGVCGVQGPWIGRQALHAVSLTLTHPGTGQPVTFQAAPPEDFVAAAAALGLDVPQLDELCKAASTH